MVAKYKSSNAHAIMNQSKLIIILGLLTYFSTSLSQISPITMVSAAKLKQTSTAGFYTGPAIIGPIEPADA